MKKLLKSLILLVGVGTAGWGQIYMDMAMDTTMSYEDIVSEGESFFDQHGRGQHTGYKSFKRWQYWMKRCLDKEGHMMSGAKVNDAFQRFQAAKEPSKRNINIPTWTDLGPYEAGNTNGWSSHLGRITSIAIDDNNIDHILVGSPTGGVWKTTNGGAQWEPIYDFETVLDIYSLAISPHNSQHYYIGTWGAGIRRSVDGGQTWTETNGVNVGTRIIDIAVSPEDPKICIAINEGGNVFQSSDGGNRWDVSLIHTGTLYDVEFKPSDANIVYASGKGAVFISEDKGWTFTELDGPWKESGMIFNPIMLAVSDIDPNYIYALEGDNGGFGALYLSKDGGNTFTTRSSDVNGDNNLLGYAKTTKGGQAPRDMDIAVNPLDKNEVHIGGIMTHRSLDGGQNWEQTSHWLRNDPLPFIHADIDIIVYKGGRAFFGTDGGLFTSDDSGISFTDRSTGLSIRQFYRMAVSKDGELLVGGSQDNGAGLLKDSNGWWDFIGADGMEPIIDKNDKDLIYASIQYGNIYKTSNGGVTLDGGVTQTPGFGDWVTPIEQDPIIPNTLYQGKSQLYKTSDGMKSWTIISDFVHTNVNDTLMQEIDISPTDSDYIVAGFEEKVYKTLNGGASWIDISPAFPFSNVNYISIHPSDKNWIVMALSGTDSRVVQTRNGGANWESLMSNLPNTGAECVLYEGGPKNGIYVSMNPGVYYRDGSSADWQLISLNMPKVLVAEMEISGCKIYAATYGRGLWSAPLIDDTEYYSDLDNDGYGDENNAIRYCEAEGNYSLVGGDCDDTNNSINPLAAEVCNGLDDDCNGLIDADDPNNSSGEQIWYRDADGDSYGNNLDWKSACSPPVGYVVDNTDCNDNNAGVNPGGIEICNGLDDDCNGFIDSSDSNFIGRIQNWYRDADGDSYGDETKLQVSCAAPEGYVLDNNDCDDSNPAVHPSASEICNGLDDDCNGLTDSADPNNTSTTQSWYKDTDGDGYGDSSNSLVSCTAPIGYVLTSGDCNDNNATVYPSAIEECNGLDNDCNGLVDDNPLLGSMENWYRDNDGDGYGDALNLVRACARPAGYVLVADDCNDSDASINPASAEICNGIDDDCNGLVDGDDPSNSGESQPWYLDFDGDGYGDPDKVIMSCDAPLGYVEDGTDCNDNNRNIHPEGIEICNGLDDNCNGLTDSADSELEGASLWFADLDGDGYGFEGDFLYACSKPRNFVSQSGDCDDDDPEIKPESEELCDGLDNNCDGIVDENCGVVDCDGNYLFIHASFQGEYHAGTALYSDAELTGPNAQLFAAGSSIDLLPGFEVGIGKQFEAVIKPCFNGVSPISNNLDADIKVLEETLLESLQKKELVQLRVIDRVSMKTIHVVFSKKQISLPHALGQLPTGQFTILVDALSFSWNREIDVIGMQ